jgi:hypothetical protein
VVPPPAIDARATRGSKVARLVVLKSSQPFPSSRTAPRKPPLRSQHDPLKLLLLLLLLLLTVCRKNVPDQDRRRISLDEP